MAGLRVALGAALLAASAGASHIRATGSDADWRMIGHDPANSRNAPDERRIRPGNVNRLLPKWTATTTGDVSATPAVVDGAVYFGDFGGTVWKLNADTGAVIWSVRVADLTGHSGDYARTSPSLAGNTLVVGVIHGTLSTNPCGTEPTACPNMLGINAQTGKLRWATRIHDDPRAAMTGSPVLAGDMVITGISANGAGGSTSTFRAAIVALNAQSGQILWRTFSVPGSPAGTPVNETYAGATMFAPPAVDLSLGLVYGTFGQAYHVPDSVTACHAARDAAAGGFDETCETPGAFWKSLVAFDLQTGAPRWSYRLNRSHGLCDRQPAGVTWCTPDNDPLAAETWDLGGSGPNVMRLRIGRHHEDDNDDRDAADRDAADDGGDADGGGSHGHRHDRDVVGIGAKSGVYTLFDAKTGTPIWSTLVGPGGDQGGVEWGTAFDGSRIYVPITNQHHIPYKLTQNGVLDAAGPTITGGSWSALDPITGKILWQTADPQLETLTSPGPPPTSQTVGVWDLAPLSVANEVVYAGSMAKLANQNQFFALDAANGGILWQWGAGSSVNAGPAIVNGSVYWGSGYSRSGVEGSGNTKFFAFSLNGK
jgi:polyvinyl alcohol dehydrogenase (cytochrome)